MPHSLAQSSLRTIVMMAARIIVQGSTLIFVTRALGPAIYGGYIAAASLAVVLGLIPNLGSGYILMTRASHSPSAVTDTWSYGWPLSLALGTVLSILFPFIAHPVAAGILSYSSLAIIGAVELLVSPLTLLLCFVLQSVGRVPTGQFVLTLPLLLRMIAAAACLIDDRISLIGFLILQGVAALAGLVAAFLVTSRIVTLTRNVRRPTSDEIRIGSGYAAMHMVAANPAEIDKIVSPLLLGDHAAGVYSATSRVMNAVVMPVVGVLLASQPRLFRHAAEPTDEGHRLITILMRLAFFWGALGGIAMFLTAPLLPIIFGSAYADAATLMPWMALAAPFVSLRLAAGTVLVALGHPLQRLQFELAGIVILSVLLVLGSQVAGPRGMAVALSLAECAMACYGWLLVRRAERMIRA